MQTLMAQELSVEKLAWFWTNDPPALWVGIAGKAYPNSKQVEPVQHNTSREAAMEIFVRQVSPYARYCIPPGKTPTLYPNKVFS